VGIEAGVVEGLAPAAATAGAVGVTGTIGVGVDA